MEKLSSRSNFDLSGIQTKLHEVTNLLNKVPDIDSVLGGKFEANGCLKDILSKPGFSLGKAYMISHDHIKNETGHNPETKSEEVTGKKENLDSESQTKSAESSSKEVVNTGKREKTIKQNAAVSGPSMKQRDKPWRILNLFLERSQIQRRMIKTRNLK